MRKVLAGTLLLIAVVLAGCGGGSSPSGSGGNGEASKSAQQVVADATQAAESASSLHVSGQVTKNGQQIGIDLTIAKGKGSTGSVTLKGQKIELEIIGGDAYLKAGTAFWTLFAGAEGSAAAQLFANRWLKFPTSNPQFAGFTSIANSKSLFDQINANHGTLKNTGATTYKGQSVVGILDETGGETLYVSGTGTAYPVAIVKTGGGSPGTVTFDSWNESVSLTAPSGAVDFSQLTGG